MDIMDPRCVEYRTEKDRIRRLVGEAIPTGVSYAAIIGALGEELESFCLSWVRQSVKRWKKPDKESK